MLEFGKEVLLSSSRPFLFSKLLSTCLGKGKSFGFVFFYEEFLDAFPFYFIASLVLFLSPS